MRRLYLSFALLSLAMPAMAGASTGIALTAEVPAVCAIGHRPAERGIDSALTDFKVMCNFSVQIELTSKNGGLRSAHSSAIVPYTATAHINGLSVILNTAKAKTAKQFMSMPIAGTLNLRFDIPKSGLDASYGIRSS